MIFAVDFDGTIVVDRFPKMGEEQKDAIKVMRALQEKGHKIIVWTCRCHYDLVAMISWLNEHDFHPNAVNANLIDAKGFAVPKIYADVYLDDRGWPPFPGWDAVYEEFVMKPTIKGG
jgi:hypothetical protein